MLVRRYSGLLGWLVVLSAILSLRLVNYLLFHTAVELVSVVVSFAIFTLAWSLRHTLQNRYLLFLGIASAFIGSIDLLHALTYKGMGVVPGIDADTPTQFWIAGRYIQSLTFLLAPLALTRKFRNRVVLGVYAVATVVLAWLVMVDWFPQCFLPDTGLTPFKKISEYVVSVILAAGLYLLQRRKSAFDSRVVTQLTWAIGLTIVGELLFTLYMSVTDIFNLLGHLVRLSSYYLLYLAMVDAALARPMEVLYGDLKRSEAALKVERNFVTGVLDTASALMIVTDADGRIVRFNQACEELSGYTAAEVVGTTITHLLLPPGEHARVQSGMRQLYHGGIPSIAENVWRLKNGEQRWISWSISTLKGEDGAVAYVVGTGMDVTERRQAEAELKEREERLRMMVESVQSGMVLIDRQAHTIVNANPAAAAMIGLQPEQIAGRSCREFFHCVNLPGRCPFDEGVDLSRCESVLTTAAGQQIPIHRSAASVVNEGREFVMESFVDMTQQKQLEEELRSLSMIDELTGLYNRRGFTTLAQKEIDSAVRVGGALALLYIDVNGMKEINDTHGHGEGDRVLKLLGQILKQAFRETNLIARVGGDEFVVLAPQFVGARPSLLVDRLNRHLEDFNTASGRNYELGVCTGVARLQPEKPCSVMELFNQADTNMYVEKRRKAMAGSRAWR